MKKILLAAVAALSLDCAFAGWSPLGIGIAAPVQFPFMSSDVYGLRLGGFFGCNENVYGLDCGIGGEVATGNAYALQSGLFNVVWGEAGGVQAGLVNYDGNTFGGLQVGALCNWVSLEAYGFQVATVNADQTGLTGFALGALNFAGSVKGVQIGCINLADSVTGFQIGLINACDRMRGFQLGAINMITTSPLPVMVLANVRF